MPYRVLFALAVTLSLTGCRTYGEYDSLDAMKEQMLLVVARQEARAESVQADVNAMQLAAEGNPALQPLAEEWHTFALAQEALVQSHRELLAELEEADWYRPVNRALGALISEGRMMELRYQQLLTLSQPPATGPDSVASGQEFERGDFHEFTLGGYSIAQPFYARLTEPSGRIPASSLVEVERTEASSAPVETPAPDSAAVPAPVLE